MKALKRKARQRETSFSEELRTAVSRYISGSDHDFSEQEINALINHANESMDRMTAAMERAHQSVQNILPLIKQDERVALSGKALQKSAKSEK